MKGFFAVMLVACAAMCVYSAVPGPVCLGGPKECVGEGDLCYPADVCDEAGQFCEKQCPPGLGCLRSYPDGMLRCRSAMPGDLCTQDSDCQSATLSASFQPQMICSTATYFCVNSITNLLPGDFCTVNDECNSGVCLDGRCKGEVAGANCNADNDCEVGFWCENNAGNQTCVAQVDSCASGDTDECRTYAADCVNGVCTPIGSIDFGGSCNDFFSLETVCAQGLNCVGGTCSDSRALTALVGANCTLDQSICNGLQCVCDGTSTNGDVCVYVTVNHCPAQITTFLQCLQDNGCRRDSEANLERACAFERCSGEWSDALNCALPAYIEDLSAVLPGSCSFRAAPASQLDSFLF